MTTNRQDSKTRLCPTCQAAGPVTEGKIATLWSENDTMVTLVHAADCPDHLAEHAHMMESAERVRQEEERAQELFPDVHARFQAALQALPADQAAAPFATALAELVALQAGRFYGHGGFVILPEWADVLDRHFPRAER